MAKQPRGADGGESPTLRDGEGAELVARARAGELAELPGGRNNQVFRAGAGLGGAVVVKLYRGADRVEREVRALGVMAGSGLTPQLLHVDRGGVPAVVISELVGEPLAGVRLQPGQVDALAVSLARVYSRPLPAACPPVATTWQRMLERVADAVGGGDAPGLVARLWERWVRGGGPEVLAGGGSAVFGRGDPNLANCLWDGSRVALVDWEYAGVSDRAYELADLVEHPESRSTAERSWVALVDRFALDTGERLRFRAARGLLAMFWLTRVPSADARWEALAGGAAELIEQGHA